MIGKLKFLLVIFLCFFIVSPIYAANVSLGWDDPNPPEANVEGYKIYIGTNSGIYTEPLDVGLSTTVTVDNLNEGITYYFAATCYNHYYNESNEYVFGESGYSNEVSYLIPINIYCGDGVCNGTETCSTCPQDCGICPPTLYFTIKSYVKGSGGSIIPSGYIQIAKGLSQTFYFYPNKGKCIKSVSVDGTRIKTQGNSYTFNNITSGHKIYVTFGVLNKRGQCR